MTIRAAAALILATGLMLGIAGCTPTPAPTADPSSAPSSESPKPVESVEPEPEPEGLTDADVENLIAALDTGNTAAIEGYLSDPVNFIIAASECCGPMTPFEAVSQLDYTSGASAPWSQVDEATIDGYRAHFYVDYFPADAIVLASSDADPYVISFTVSGSQITGIFIGSDFTLLM